MIQMFNTTPLTSNALPYQSRFYQRQPKFLDNFSSSFLSCLLLRELVGNMTTALPDTQFIMEFGTFEKFFFKDDGVIALLLPLLLQFQDNRIFCSFFRFLVFENANIFKLFLEVLEKS